MGDFYVYLISSLPVLHFEGNAPFSFETFLGRCRDFIPQKDWETLTRLSPEYLWQQEDETARKFLAFEILLRNELVYLRALRKKVAPEKYIRPDGLSVSSVHHIAVAAQRSPSPLEAERILDRARWEFLEELNLGHYFDRAFLIIYGLKLLILERWEKVNKADKGELVKDSSGASR